MPASAAFNGLRGSGVAELRGYGMGGGGLRGYRHGVGGFAEPEDCEAVRRKGCGGVKGWRVAGLRVRMIVTCSV